MLVPEIDEHRKYLNDKGRVSAFAEAIAESVRPDDVVVDLGAGETEVEEDQVGFVEAIFGADRAELGKASLNQNHAGPKRSQRHPSSSDGSRIAVDPEQPATGCDPLQDLAGMARLPEGAVDRDRPPSGLEQLYYLL